MKKGRTTVSLTSVNVSERTVIDRRQENDRMHKWKREDKDPPSIRAKMAGDKLNDRGESRSSGTRSGSTGGIHGVVSRLAY
jgi:hypothetical protein